MTVVDQLSEISGISKPEMNAIWEQVKANHKRLDECVGPHVFTREVSRTGKLVRRWACERCGGEIETVDKSWYEMGLKHGRQEQQ